MLSGLLLKSRRTLRQGMVENSGSTAIEYALLASLIAVAAIGGFTATGTSVNTMIQDVATRVGAALAD